MSERIDIDGAQGEGGGQILRTALALVAGHRPAVPHRPGSARGRRKPGLLRQHLTAVQAAGAVGGEAAGAELGAHDADVRAGRGARRRAPPGGGNRRQRDAGAADGAAGAAAGAASRRGSRWKAARTIRRRRRSTSWRGRSCPCCAGWAPAIEPRAGGARLLPGRRRALHRGHRAGAALRRLSLIERGADDDRRARAGRGAPRAHRQAGARDRARAAAARSRAVPRRTAARRRRSGQRGADRDRRRRQVTEIVSGFGARVSGRGGRGRRRGRGRGVTWPPTCRSARISPISS